MKDRILGYRQGTDRLLKEAPADTDWESVKKEHLIQLSFFQHERLVHLIVTVTVALLLLLSVATAVIGDYVYMLFTALLFLVLLVPYIAHYYLLENEVQRMYAQYDEIVKKAAIHTEMYTEIHTEKKTDEL